MLICFMKISSIRSDVVVVGGGFAGICAAISAAREGCTVSLVEKNKSFGGKVDYPHCYPFEDANSTPQIYKRDSGLINEIWHKFFKYNEEGTYVGQARVLKDWVVSEKRIRFFLRTEVESLNFENGRIKSVTAKDHFGHSRIAFLGKYFLDCTGAGKISELADIQGEKGIDKNESLPKSESNYPEEIPSYSSCLIRIEKSDQNSTFICPEWVNVEWEDNHLSARLNLMKSLESNLLGEHQVEWESVNSEKSIDPWSVAFAAWDYLKNRSPIRKIMENLKLIAISENMVNGNSFRVHGNVTMTLNDLIEGKEWEDSIALGKVSVPLNFSQLSWSQNSCPIVKPFEIPLSAMITKSCKNLFTVGSSSSSTALASRSLGLPACATQMSTVTGIIASMCVEKNRLPVTIAKKEYLNEIRNKLYRNHHTFCLNNYEDLDNLSVDAKITASSTLEDAFECLEEVERFVETNRCQFQFPVTSSQIDRLIVSLQAEKNQVFALRLFEGTDYQKSIPGLCLHSDTIEVDENTDKLECKLGVKLNSSSWHFLELISEQKFQVPLFSNGPVGYIFYKGRSQSEKSKTKPLSDYEPIVTCSPLPSLAPKLEVFPKSKIYQPENLVDHTFRPDSLPNLWISKATDFQYPEFIEIEWEKAREISCIELSFDPSYDFVYPQRPKSMISSNFHSLVKDYRIYFYDENKKSKLIEDIKDNHIAFRSHSFESITAKGIELEILSTHGLNRAQIYQVRIYA